VVTVTRLGDRYEIESQIAVGGMGIVYRARDLRLGRAVAIKILKDHLSHDERFVERFRREARAVASLSHPNIASLYDYGEDEGRHFIVMECVDGRDLSTVLREEGALEPQRAAAITRAICSALAVAHEDGIIHRDVKPANVLLTPEDVVKVTDFGIARAAGDSTLTATGSILGTAHYLAPEQAAGEPASPATDVYATGVVLFEMLTGIPPFSGDSPVAIATRHLNDELPSPRTIDPNVPVALETVVKTATAKQAKNRYPDAGAMGDALTVAGRTQAPGMAAAAAATTEMSAPSAQTAQIPKLSERLRSVRLPAIPPHLRGRRAGALLLIGLSAVALALLAFRLVETPERDNRPVRGTGDTRRDDVPAQPEPVMVVVPGVEGQSLDAAVAALQGAGLDWNAVGDADGFVVEAEPPGGSEVPEGSPVTLTVVASDESDDDDDKDEEGDSGPPGHAKGRGKDKKKDKEKDD
jgi:serine/threonine-protein kinase